uniref:palmitoyl-protein hydrolase n=1 Tax=Caenorhabditis tropicalis TaxID=1561998 RepID=A0A1I7UC06_9PELO
MLRSRNAALSTSRCVFLSGLFTRVLLSSAAVSTQSSSSTVLASKPSQQKFLASIIGSSLSSRLLCSLGGSSPSDEEETPMSISQGTPAVVKPRGEQKGTLIFLHGLGDQGHGWADSFSTEARVDTVKVICPHSSERSVSLNMGMRMPAWYDLFGLSLTSPEDNEGIQNAAAYVHSLIDAEVAAGVPASKVIVGGFSMGGALAIYAGLTYPQKLGGIIGLSSFFLQRTKFPGAYTANNATNIFLGHGNVDQLVPFQFGQMSETLIKKFNPNVQLHAYRDMGHQSCAEEMRDVKAFISNNIGK